MRAAFTASLLLAAQVSGSDAEPGPHPRSRDRAAPRPDEGPRGPLLAELSVGTPGSRDHERGIVQIKPPGRMRWEYKDPEDKLFVSDGQALLFYVPADKQVIVSEQDVEHASPRGCSRAWAGSSTSSTPFVEEPAEAGRARLSLVPRQPTADVERVTWTSSRGAHPRDPAEGRPGRRTRFRFEGVQREHGRRGRRCSVPGAAGRRGDPGMRRHLPLTLALGRVSGCAILVGASARARGRSAADYDRAVLEYPRAAQARARQRATTSARSTALACARRRTHTNRARRCARRANTTRPLTSTGSRST